MKQIALSIIAIFFLASCGNTVEKKEEIKESRENMQSTADVLAVLPAAYTGMVGSDISDSIQLYLTLEKDQSYKIKQTFFGLAGSKKDTTDFDNGTWNITDENIITLSSVSKNKNLYRFKVANESEILMVDSTGREIIPGKNFKLLKTVADSTAVN